MGNFALRIDDEPRMCIFGDKQQGCCGGVHVLNVSLTARAMSLSELREVHSDLSNGIEKSWAVTKTKSDSQDLPDLFDNSSKFTWENLDATNEAEITTFIDGSEELISSPQLKPPH